MSSSLEGLTATLIRAVEAHADQRASPRVGLSAEVDLSSETNFFSGFSIDIAQGGLFVATLATLPLGTAVTLKFTLPDGTEVNASGDVRWVRLLDERCPGTLPGMGIRFLELSTSAKAAIEEFVSQREPMFFPD